MKIFKQYWLTIKKCLSLRRLLYLLLLLVFILASPTHALDDKDLRAIYGDWMQWQTYSDCTPSGNSSSDPGSVSLKAGDKVYILGDSITVRSESQYRSAFTAKQVSPIINASVGRSWIGGGQTGSGNISQEGSAKPAKEAVEDDKEIIKSAGAIVVALGSNGGLQSNPIEEIINNIKAKNSTAPIFWINTAGTSAWTATNLSYLGPFNQELSGKSAALKYTVVDWFKKVNPTGDSNVSPTTDSAGLLADGLHPNENGTTVLSELLAGTLGSVTSKRTLPPDMTSSAPVKTSLSDLARQMLDNSNISYWTNNGVNTKDVVIAMSQGQPPYTTSDDPLAVQNRQASLNPNILKFILGAAREGKIMVNALTDKDHSSTSNHYKGMAVDIDNNPGNTTVPIGRLNEIAASLGGKKNDETTHYHYDFDGEAVPPSGAPAPTTQSSGSCACSVTGGAGSNSFASTPGAAPAAGGSFQIGPYGPDPKALEIWEKDYKKLAEPLIPLYQKAAQEEGVKDWELLPAFHIMEFGLRRDNPTTNTHFLSPYQMSSSYIQALTGASPSDPIFTPGKELSDDEFVTVSKYALKYLEGNASVLKLGDWKNSLNPEIVAKLIISYKSGVGSPWFKGADISNHAYAWAGWNSEPKFALPMAYGPGGTAGDEQPSIKVNRPAAATTFMIVKGGNFSAANTCAGQSNSDGGVASIDGFTFPLKTTKSDLDKGTDGMKWCKNSQKNCHHDYNAADIFVETGTPVLAAKEGTVVSASDIATKPSSAGSRIVIRGSDNKIYYYAHMGANTLKVKKGDTVTSGQEIGLVGTNANAMNTPRHLHFDILPEQFDRRVSCAGAACNGYPFFEIQPILTKAYELLPQ